MNASARHPLDDLTDNPIAQGAFLFGVMSQLKHAGWSLAMVEGFFDSIIPAEDFIAKEAALLPKIADSLGSAVLDGAAAQLPRVSVGLQKAVGSWWPSSMGGDTWRRSMDEQWGEANKATDSAWNRGVAHLGKDSVAAAMPEQQRIEYLKNMENPSFAESAGVRGQEAARVGFGASQIHPRATQQALDAVHRVQAGQSTGAQELGNAAAPIIQDRLGGNLPISNTDIADLVSGKQSVGGYIGNNWSNILSQQIKQRLGYDVDAGTLKNWMPGVGMGLAGALGSRVLGADWSTALGLGVGGGLLGGNIYQASQAGRTLGEQAGHVGKFLSGVSKQYVQPLFSPSQTPDQNAAIQNPQQPGSPGAAPAPAPAAPQTNAQAPAPNQAGASPQVQPLAPAAATAQATQNQAQQVQQSAQQAPQPGVSPAAPTTPVVKPQ